MGKKARLKRERRAEKKRSEQSEKDIEFERLRSRLISLFSEYSAQDVIVSLCVSELWIPNISSQVKHALALSVALSMKPAVFARKNIIDTYPLFQIFIEQVYKLLPDFPSLEDYVPETDWGQVKFHTRGHNLKIFYGGVVERIPDFISAFHFIHSGNDAALEDMHGALVAQDHLLSAVESVCNGWTDEIELGDIKTPNECFWDICRNAISTLSTYLEKSAVRNKSVIKLGEHTEFERRSDFSNSILDGSAIPSYLAKIGSHYYPISLRNASASIIQQWAGVKAPSPVIAISEFIKTRFKDPISGPFNIVSHSEIHPQVFSSALLGDTKTYLIIPVQENELEQLPKQIAHIEKIVNAGDWALKQIGNPGATQIRNRVGYPLTMEHLVVIAVLARINTVTNVLHIPRCKARFLPLSDFITIFDSIQNVGELDRYWAFVDSNSAVLRGFIGPADEFAAFRDTNALLTDGATTPDMITLDPHWGSTWRFTELKKYWDNAPPLFPDFPDTAWNVDKEDDDLYQLSGRGVPTLSWCAVVGNCSVHFVIDAHYQKIGIEDLQILELLAHCLADALVQRASLISGSPIFSHRRIVTTCLADLNSLISFSDTKSNGDSIISDFKTELHTTDQTVLVSVNANIRYIQQQLNNTNDASFEAMACSAWIEGVSNSLNIACESKILDSLINTSTRTPRFTLIVVNRSVDVPDFADPQVPASEHYKIARRDLAIVFRDIGASTGTYQLAEAKKLIDEARDKFRILIHERVAKITRMELTRFCVEQIDALSSVYTRDSKRIEISLGHEVNYDRAEALSEMHRNFVQEARNYRYLLECNLSLPTNGSNPVTNEKVIHLIASVDWLIVLTNASDILHNSLDVAGLELDDFFVPNVSYSRINDTSESDFANEAADNKLGVGLTATDEVRAIQPHESEWENLDQAFLEDLEIGLTSFLAVLHVLFRWPSAIGQKELRLSYSATRSQMCSVLVENIDGLTWHDAEQAISLITLDPQNIRQLIGKDSEEADVPLWEHNKRSERYSIKPLIEVENDVFIWGAASVERAARIWRLSFANGYMPASFAWPNVTGAVRSIKQRLEKQLEIATLPILLRHAPYAVGGIDFMRRFPEQNFEDVGDFDSLAYWPEDNKWVTVECKYNQPVFCLKDGRRLRDRIFGTHKNKGQFEATKRRRMFLDSNKKRIHEVLNWPPPPEGDIFTVHELYVSREIYWWMRNPPYEVSTHFVRIDALDHWLHNHATPEGA